MNHNIYIEKIKKVVVALRELQSEVVLVGGMAVGCYITDPASEEMRFTNDIDLVINLIGYSDWVGKQERLTELGFKIVPTEIICRYKYEDITVDIMPIEDTEIGTSNPWYKSGYDKRIFHNIENEIQIAILPVSYFLATKFAAFQGRGENNYRLSHDFEDIIYILDNHLEIVSEIQNSDEEVRLFLKSEFDKVIKDENGLENISVHLTSENRLPLILDKITTIITD